LGEFFDDRGRIGLDGHLHGAVSAQFAVIQVHLDDPGIRADAPAVAQPEIQGGAQDQRDVRPGESVPAGTAEETRRVGGQAASGGAVQVGGDSCLFHESKKLSGPAAGPNLGSCQDHRALGSRKEFHRTFHELCVSGHPALGAGACGNVDLPLVHLPIEDVLGNLEENRSGAAVEGLAKSRADDLGNPFGAQDRAGELGDGL